MVTYFESHYSIPEFQWKKKEVKKKTNISDVIISALTLKLFQDTNLKIVEKFGMELSPLWFN